MKIKMVRSWLIGALFACHWLLFYGSADAALITNRWAAFGSGKWETGANWDNGVPSINYSLHRLAPIGVLNSVATIDVATVSSHVINGCLTISNLTVAGGASDIFDGSSALVLSNANNTPGNIGLTIVDHLNVNARGSVIITNSRLRVGSPAPFFDDGLFVNGFLLLNTGELVTSNGFAFVGNAGSGQMTVRDGIWQAGYVAVGNGGQGTLTLAGGTTKVTSGLSIGRAFGTFMTNTGTGTVLLTGGELITTNTASIVVQVNIGRTSQMTVSNGTWRSSNVNVEGMLTIAGGTTLLWSANAGSLYVGFGSTGTVWVTGGELTVTNDDGATYVGIASKYSDSLAQMTISNGIWRAKSVVVMVRDEFDPDSQGETGSGTLTVAGGTSLISSNLTIGNSACTGTAVVKVAGGSLFVTNAAHNAILDVRGGTLTLSSGTLTVDKLVMSNYCGRFIHSGGTLSVMSTNLLPNADADGDGLPNYWEQQYGFDVFNPTTGVEDTDHDGLDNFVEYWLGTDPRNPADPFHITGITKEGNNIRITWDYVPPPGNSFEHCLVEASPTLTGAWANVSGTMTLPAGFFVIASTNYVETGGATNFPARFYRVRLVP